MKNSATAVHFIFLGACPAVRHLVIAFSKSSVFNFFSFLRVLKLILKMRFQNFQDKSPFIQRGEDRALGKFCDPLVSKFDMSYCTGTSIVWRFVGSRISTVRFRDILVSSFMTYHAIDFDRYPIFTSIVLLFLV